MNLKYLSVVLLATLLCAPAFAQTAVVQSTVSSESGAWGNAGTGVTRTPNFGTTVTLNNYIVVEGRACINIGCTTTNPVGSLTVNDTLGLLWQPCGATTASLRQSYLALWIAKITTTGPEAITINCSGCASTFYGGAFARELSGTGLTNITGLCDVSGETEGTTLAGGAASVSTSAVTNFSGELLVSDIYTLSGGCSAAPSGWTTFSPGFTGAFSTSGSSGSVQTAAWTSCTTNGQNVEGVIAAFHNATAACTGSSPNWTAADWAHVQGCHDNSAVNGDTITVATGSYTVTTFTVLTKAVTILAGAGGVTLTDNTCAGACPQPQQSNSMIQITESTAGSVRIGNAIGGGFTINSGTANHNNPGGVIYVASNNGKPVVIQGNTLNDFTQSQNWINYQPNRGVVTGNTFTSLPTGTNCFTQAQFVQSEPLGTTAQWATTVSYGAADTNGDQNLYVEGNTIRGGIVDLLSNGRVVYRYNSSTNAAPASIHGITFVNGRYMDIYNNLWIRDNSLQPTCTPANTLPENINGFIRIGGGVALIHHNTLPDPTDSHGTWGPKNAVQFTIDMLGEFKGGWPCWSNATGTGQGHPAPEQPGWGFTGSGTITVNPGGGGAGSQNQGLEPIYVWGNIGTGNYDNPGLIDYPSNQSDSCGTLGYSPVPTVAQYMTETSEYFLNVDAPAGKPGYTPFTSPHPLALLTGSSSATTNGVPGYISGAALSFTVQPANVNSGATMTSLQVTDSDNTFSGTITLTQNGCGASFTSGLTATATAGVANFTPGTSINAIGTGCAFTASASGAGSITSTTFNVVDATPPTPGNSGIIVASGITASAVTLNWTAATDNITPTNQLQYEVCQATTNSLTTVGACEVALIKTFTTNIVTFIPSSLGANTSYFFNVVVKDAAGNKAIYTSVGATTANTPNVPTQKGNGGSRFHHPH